MVQVTNTRPGGIGLPDQTVVPPGGSVEVDGKDWAAMKDHPVIKGRLEAGDLVVGEEPAPAPTYEAKHRGGGSYSVLDASGQEVAEKLTKDVAEKFNALSADEQAEFIAAKKG